MSRLQSAIDPALTYVDGEGPSTATHLPVHAGPSHPSEHAQPPSPRLRLPNPPSPPGAAAPGSYRLPPQTGRAQVLSPLPRALNPGGQRHPLPDTLPYCEHCWPNTTPKHARARIDSVCRYIDG
jgi:hypothetical protein